MTKRQKPCSAAIDSPFDPVVNRRAFLRGATILASGAFAPGLLGGCGSDSNGSFEIPLTLDPNTPWWLQNGFEPVSDELDVANLPVRGSIPSSLDGIYIRNGSNSQSATNPHWFLGDGMLHGVRLRGGRAEWYRNRFIRTEPFENGGAGGIPIGGNNESNVSAIYHAGRLLTSGEVGFPYEVNPDDLSTVGVYSFDDGLSTSFTAHSKIDPLTGYLHFFGYWLAPPYLTYHVADADGRLIHSEEVSVEASTMMHSFGITDRDVIFWELPIVFDGDGLTVHGFPYLWSDSHVERIGIMPLGGPASEIRWVEIPPAYVFHELNCFREGDEVVIDVCRYERMMDGERFGAFPPRLHRWRIDTSGETLDFRDEVVISDRLLEFPMHDKRFTGRPIEHGWFVETANHPGTVDLRGVVHFNRTTGDLRTWDPGVNRHCGEALFVPEGQGEGEGWLLTFVYNHVSRTTDLVILDALNVEAGAQAEIRLPRRVPYGFHGTWVPR